MQFSEHESRSLTPDGHAPLRRFVLAAVGVFVVWVLLSGSLEPQELGVGIAVALGVAVLSVRHLSFLDHIKLSLSLPVHLGRYFLVFFIALLKANLDVARRVVSPRLDIEPALVKVHTDLQSDLGKLWLANSITLTPGTLTVDVEGDVLNVHWIDATPGEDLVVATREIAAQFEAPLKGFLR